MIMSVLFIAASLICVERNSDRILMALAVVGSTLSVLRVRLAMTLHRRVHQPQFDATTAKSSERLFAQVYLAFALTLGLFAAYSLQTCAVQEHLVIAALVVGYAAGVAAVASLRPWIGIPALILSVVPTAASAASLADAAHVVFAFVLLAFLIGGVSSILARYKAAIDMIELQLLFASLARRDPLTDLPNRIALDEAFAKEASSTEGKRMALHCLDLDGFKPVNDRYGHPVGDLLLKAVSERLMKLARERDLAVRLGGDEFALLQTDVEHADQVDLMARRITKALERPYELGELIIEVGVSCGSAISPETAPSLTELLSLADVQLYRRKSSSARSKSPDTSLAYASGAEA